MTLCYVCQQVVVDARKCRRCENLACGSCLELYVFKSVRKEGLTGEAWVVPPGCGVCRKQLPRWPSRDLPEPTEKERAQIKEAAGDEILQCRKGVNPGSKSHFQGTWEEVEEHLVTCRPACTLCTEQGRQPFSSTVLADVFRHVEMQHRCECGRLIPEFAWKQHQNLCPRHLCRKFDLLVERMSASKKRREAIERRVLKKLFSGPRTRSRVMALMESILPVANPPATTLSSDDEGERLDDTHANGVVRNT